MEIYQEFTFDAAHRFPGVPEGHPYHGLHGHSFVARIVLLGEVDPKTGFIADLGEIEKSCVFVSPKGRDSGNSARVEKTSSGSPSHAAE